MPVKPFHHGNLRTELLDRAARTLHDAGAQAISLRQLARDAGVTHAAPRRHFPDRQSLLDALAVQGFEQLVGAVHDIAQQHDIDAIGAFRAVARTYVNFAIEDAALMDLMFSAKNSATSAEVQAAAADFFHTVSPIVSAAAPASGSPVPTDVRLQLLLVSTLQGIATLVAAGRVQPEQTEQLIDDATALFTHGMPPTSAVREL